MKKIEIDTFLKFRFLSNPHFSPDGTKIAFTVSVPDRETNGYLSDLYLYDLGKKTVSVPPAPVTRRSGPGQQKIR